MGELGKKIGDKLENFGENLFKIFNWELKTQDLQIKCLNSNHKNHKDKQKRTHGVDLLFKYFNPFNNRAEAVIVECKNRKWQDYTSSNLTNWIEELLNTVECSSSSQEVAPFIENCILTSGILLFNCNDSKYNNNEAIKIQSEMVIPRRKNPTMLYFADNTYLERWYSLGLKINDIKKKAIQDFGVIYPSIDSSWAKNDCIIPELLFSDYISTSHLEKRQIDNTTEKTYEIKSIFCFDKVTNSANKYVKDMIKTMQLGAYNSSNCQFYIYWYPKSEQDIELIKSFNNNQENYQYIPMDNRSISRVEYGN